MYTAYKNYAFQALIVQDGTKLRLLRKEIIDRFVNWRKHWNSPV